MSIIGPFWIWKSYSSAVSGLGKKYLLLFTAQSGIRHYDFGKWFSKRSICIRRYLGSVF